MIVAPPEELFSGAIIIEYVVAAVDALAHTPLTSVGCVDAL